MFENIIVKKKNIIYNDNYKNKVEEIAYSTYLCFGRNEHINVKYSNRN